MPYPDFKQIDQKIDLIKQYINLEHELDSSAYLDVLQKMENDLNGCLQSLSTNSELIPIKSQEPDNWDEIQLLASGNASSDAFLLDQWDSGQYRDRLEGALLGRFAGCLLGVPVELWPVEKMKRFARENGDAFPPVDYWSAVHDPELLRYNTHKFKDYAKDKLCGVPVDDDIIYTLLGMLVLERHGVDFTLDQLGACWKDLVPIACTAEEVAQKTLKMGFPLKRLVLSIIPTASG